MNYAKLINNILRTAPKTLQWRGHTVNNPSADKLQELGYKPVTYTDMSADAPAGRHYESSWTETDTEIVQIWTLADDPAYPEPEPTIADLTEAVERGLTT